MNVFDNILDRLEQTKDIPDDDSVAEAVSTRVWNKAIQRAKFVVKEVAEEYKNGWIPCSERLPDADENVLTCSEYGFITVSSCNDAGEFSSYADEYCIKYPKPKVIAWQPLPEPYKPEGE